MNDLSELYKEIEEIFGIQKVNRVNDIIGKLIMRVKELEDSRDNWKAKYMLEKFKNKNRKKEV